MTRSANIRDASGFLFKRKAVVELRVLETPRGVVSGYFDDPQALEEDATTWSGRGSGVYVTLNPVTPELLARAANRVKPYAKHTTSERDILRLRHLLGDFDPVRRSGISSTDEEHRAALRRTVRVCQWLRARGWPEPVIADSGNGYHLVYAIDLPNDEPSRRLLNRCLQALNLLFSDGQVLVDVSTAKAAQLWKLPGTLACKGDDLPDRPHRLAVLLQCPNPLGTVTRVQLEQLAALVPTPPQPATRVTSNREFDLNNWIEEHRLPVVATAEWNGGQKWILSPCPWNPDHTDRAAYIVRFPSGAIAAGCHHNGCTGKDWQALRDLIEPNRGGSQLVSAHDLDHLPHIETWPHLAQEALQGLAGEFVETIDPYTEADPVAVLGHFLTAFGNLIGPEPHARVGHDRHPARLNMGFVGRTGKGRKGMALSPTRHVFGRIDPSWARSRIKTGLSSGEGLIFHVRDLREETRLIKKKNAEARYEPIVVDEGESDKRLLAVEPEFAVVLRRMAGEGNSLSGVLRQAWDSGDLATLTKNSPLAATGAHISFIAHITEEELRRYLTETERANGFGNRFCWLLVRRSKMLPRGEPVPDRQLDPLAEKVRAAVRFSRRVDEIRRSQKAERLWADVYPSLSEGEPGMIGAILSRAEAQVLRLSLVYALLDHSDEILPQHLKAALAFWAYAETSARRIFVGRLGAPVADTILAALSARRSMTETDLWDLLGRHGTKEEIHAALDFLERTSKARKTQRSTGGRPAVIWEAV